MNKIHILRLALLLLVGLGTIAGCSDATSGPDPSDSASAGDCGAAADCQAGADTAADAAQADIAVSSTPTVLSTVPLTGATSVALNTVLSAHFSLPMNPATLSGLTFKVSLGPVETAVDGTVTYAAQTAVFTPLAPLVAKASYTATLTTGAASSKGVPLAAEHTWTFSTGESAATVLPVNLGTAAGFAVLAKSGVSTVPASAVTGNLGVSPAAATYITGFSLTADATNVFSTSPQVTGKIYASNYAPPTPSNMSIAIGDMELAFTDAAGRTASVTELGAGNIGGLTLPPAVYKWSTGVAIPTSVTLSGKATDVWILQIAKGLTLSTAATVFLAGGAQAKNVFWQVSGAVDLGTTSHAEGTILCKTAIRLHTGASINGRLLAQTAVNLESSTVVVPAP